MSDLVTDIMNYEGGELSNNEVVDLFAKLVSNGMAWTLQGHYGRTAMLLIQEGYINKNGEVLKYYE